MIQFDPCPWIKKDTENWGQLSIEFDKSYDINYTGKWGQILQ